MSYSYKNEMALSKTISEYYQLLLYLFLTIFAYKEKKLSRLLTDSNEYEVVIMHCIYCNMQIRFTGKYKKIQIWQIKEMTG